MKAARCAPDLCGGKPNDLAAGTAGHRLNFLAARLIGTENPPKRTRIWRMSDNAVSGPGLGSICPVLCRRQIDAASGEFCRGGVRRQKEADAVDHPPGR